MSGIIRVSPVAKNRKWSENKASCKVVKYGINIEEKRKCRVSPAQTL